MWYSLRLIAGLMLLVAVAPLPYPYYMLLRVIVCAVGAYSSYKSHISKNVEWMWAFGIIAALFNPFFPAHLTKEVWIVFDMVAAAVFFFSLRKVKDK